MFRQRPIRPARERSQNTTLFDRVTDIAFMAVLMISAAAFISYGPGAACKRIAEALDTGISTLAGTDAPNWDGFTAN